MTEPANEVERRLHAARTEPGAVSGFLEALATGRAWIPGAGGAAEGPRVVRAGETLGLPLWELPDGRRYVPLYTSEECLRATVPDGTPFVALDVAGLLDAVEPEAWLGVNPGTESGVVLPANVVRGAVGPQQAAAGTEYAIGEPATEPAELLDDLRHWFAAEQPGVARAWRAQLALSGRAPEPLIGLELEPGTELDPVFAAVVDRVERHGRGPVTLVPVDPTAPEGPAAWLLERTRPFYVRGA